jgi:ankyrin repeat protein
MIKDISIKDLHDVFVFIDVDTSLNSITTEMRNKTKDMSLGELITESNNDNHLPIIIERINKGELLNEDDHTDRWASFCCVENNNLQTINYLINIGYVKPDDTDSDHGHSLLDHAEFGKQYKIIKYLLELRADPNVKNCANGETLLDQFNKDSLMFKLIQEHGGKKSNELEEDEENEEDDEDEENEENDEDEEDDDVDI